MHETETHNVILDVTTADTFLKGNNGVSGICVSDVIRLLGFRVQTPRVWTQSLAGVSRLSSGVL